MVARALVLLVAAFLALGAGPVLAESLDPGGGSTADATETDTTDVDSDGDTSSDADAAGVRGSGTIELFADDFIGIDGELYFVDDTALLDGLAAGDSVSSTYELDDASGTNGEPDADNGDVDTSDSDAAEDNGVDADAGSDPNDGVPTEDGDDGVNNGDETAGDGTIDGLDGSKLTTRPMKAAMEPVRRWTTSATMATPASGDDGSEGGRRSAAASSAQRRGLRAYNVLRYQVLPEAPEAARQALLRTIQRLADRLGLIVDFSGDAAEGDAGALDPAALGLGEGKAKHAEKFADKHGDADAPSSDSEVSGDDSSKGSDGPPRGRGRGRTR